MLPPGIILIVVAVLVTGCGDAIESKVSNDEACRDLSLAIHTRCASDGEFKFLNCDVLPGCPSGEVDGVQVEACRQEILNAASCDEAKAVSCNVPKTGCGEASAQFSSPRGFDEACDIILAKLTEKGCADADIQRTVCATTYLKSDGLDCSINGAFDGGDLDIAVVQAGKATDCAGAQKAFVDSAPAAKYCVAPVAETAEADATP